MNNKSIALLGVLLFSQCALAEQVLVEEKTPQVDVIEFQPDPEDYVNLHSIPLFKEAYYNWRIAKSVGEELDPLSVIWELALQTGTYLDVSKKLASAIKDPDDSTTMHWAIPDIISILLVANEPEKAKPWIQALRDFDDKLMVPLYPLFALVPEVDVRDVDEGMWKNYQIMAYSDRGIGHVKEFNTIMANREKYTHDQMVVLMVKQNLLR